MDVTTLDGRAFEKFVAAGTYFLRKYRGVLNDLNVFPVPDGDTGSNMYLTARSALAEVQRAKGEPLSSVAAAAAHGSLMGARGNSGVILSQMLRGFAHNVRHRPQIDTLDLAIAMREAVGTARSSLQKPVEGTMITVAGAAADAAYSAAQREPDFYRLASTVVRAAADALERTPEQLPVLKEAGVVDSGGAGIVYFLEGILRFLPETETRTTAFPRRPSRKRTFTAAQVVSANKFCTEFILEDATIENHPLRDLLERRGDSLIVAGAAPTLKVHIHTADPDGVKALAAKHGRLTREKVEDMERQHSLLVVDAPRAAVRHPGGRAGRRLRANRSRTWVRRRHRGGRREPERARARRRGERLPRAARLPAGEQSRCGTCRKGGGRTERTGRSSSCRRATCRRGSRYCSRLRPSKTIRPARRP